MYTKGSRIILQQGYILDPEESGQVCMHSLASIMPYYTALAKGVRAVDLGLAKNNSNEAYVQCPDPCDLTGGGTVRFEISRLD